MVVPVDPSTTGDLEIAAGPPRPVEGDELGPKTVDRWRDEILAYHTTGDASNGPTEAVNLIIEKIRRIGHGYRNLNNYQRARPG